MTPIQHPLDEDEERYNIAHKRTRQCVERSFGLLKQRFRCLHRDGGSLTFEPGKCCKIVVACMVLHNICVNAQLPLDEDEGNAGDEGSDEDATDDDDDDDNDMDDAAFIDRRAQQGAVQLRRNLAHERFGRL